jgi:hypothetical protein
VLFFNWEPFHEGVLGEWKYSSTHSLTSALDGVEWSASRPARFTPREWAYGTHWLGGWMGPRAVLDAVSKWKISSHRRESNPDHSIFQHIASRYTDWLCAGGTKGKSGKVFIVKSFMICTLNLLCLGWSNQWVLVSGTCRLAKHSVMKIALCYVSSEVRVAKGVTLLSFIYHPPL